MLCYSSTHHNWWEISVLGVLREGILRTKFSKLSVSLKIWDHKYLHCRTCQLNLPTSGDLCWQLSPWQALNLIRKFPVYWLIWKCIISKEILLLTTGIGPEVDKWPPEPMHWLARHPSRSLNLKTLLQKAKTLVRWECEMRLECRGQAVRAGSTTRGPTELRTVQRRRKGDRTRQGQRVCASPTLDCSRMGRKLPVTSLRWIFLLGSKYYSSVCDSEQ